MNTDEAQNEWEKEHRPEMWIKAQWRRIQGMMAELAEVLEANPEITTNLMEGEDDGEHNDT